MKHTSALILKSTIAAAIFAASPAFSASVSKSYSYFSIGGNTLSEIEKELNRHGPKVQSTGKRHPGATTMEFTTKLTLAEGRRCSVENVHVTVKARINLPRWRARGSANEQTAVVWDTLSSDIKRHEESHVIIAKNHARQIEQALKALGSFDDCSQLRARASEVSEQILARHDKAQERFDRVEGINFENRMMRLLNYRYERIRDGRLPPSK